MTLTYALYLFIHELVLFSSQTYSNGYGIVELGLTDDQKVDILFVFKFPETVELSAPNGFHASEGFEHRHGHALPPSYAIAATSAWTQDTDEVVEYYLEGKLYSTTWHHPDTTVRQQLTFKPPTPPLDAMYPEMVQSRPYFRNQTILIKSSKLHPHYHAGESLLKRMKLSLGKTKETFVQFHIQASCPNTVAAGAVLPITLCFAHLYRTREVLEEPLVCIRRVRVRLLASLRIRMPRDSGVFSNQDRLNWHTREACLLGKKLQIGDGVVLYDGLKLEYLGMVKVDSMAAPTFKSYGVTLGYEIEVIIWGECTGETFQSTACRESVELVSNVDRVDFAETDLSPDEEGTSGPLPYAPPPYEE